MSALGPPSLGFAIAAVLTWLELITSKYPRTFGFIIKSWALWAYCLIYGLIAFAVLLGFDALVAAGVVKAEGLGISHPWVRAAAIGVSVKALLHIRLFTVSAGSQPFPVGVETLVQLFEPWLLDRVAQDEDDRKRDYADAKRKRFTAETDAQIKTKLTTNIRKNLPPPERAAIAIDIGGASSGAEAMIVYLDRFGRASLDRLYP